MTTKKPLPDLLVVDTETGGLDHEKHDIIELAAVRLNPTTLERVGSCHARVFPLKPVADEARRINGYDEELWGRTAVHFSGFLPTFNALLEGTMIVGKNPDFDWRFLQAGARAHGLQLAKRASHRMIDVASLAWPLMVNGELESVGLDAIAEYFGFTDDAHRAMGDVERTIKAYIELLSLWLPAADTFAAKRAGAREAR